MDLFLVGAARRDFAGVGQHLRQAGRDHGLLDDSAVELAFLFGEARRLGFHGRNHVQPCEQPRAALGLGNGAEPQAVLLRPAARKRDQAPHVAALEFELQLAHGRFALLGRARMGDDLADVERQFDHGAAGPGGAHVAREPHDVGGLALDQRRAARGQHLGEPVAHGRALVALRVDGRHCVAARRGAKVDVVFEPVQRVVARGLGGLHPARALLAQPQHDALGGQCLVGGVEVARLQAGADDGAAPQGGLDGFPAPRGNMKLELDFHGGHDAPFEHSWTRRQREKGLHAHDITRPHRLAGRGRRPVGQGAGCRAGERR